MADVIFNTFRRHIAADFDWHGATTLKAQLVDNGAWTPDADDANLAAILAAGATFRSTAETLTACVVTQDDTNNRGLLDSSSVVISGGGDVGNAYDWLLLYNFVTDNSDSWPVAAFDLGAKTVATFQVFSPHADGWFEIE